MADKLAVIQSQETINELNSISNSVDKLIGSFNQLIEVSGKFNKGMGTPKELIDSTKELNALYRENVKNIKALEVANNQLATAKAKLVKLEQQQAQTAKVINTSTATQAKGASQLAGAFDELNQKYLAAKKNAMDMGVQHGIASKQFTDAVAVASKYGNALNQLDTAMRNYNSNINKSTGGMLGLNMQMQQVIREAPNFGMDLRLGIAALSNNLPYLADAISNVREQNKAMKLEFTQSAKAAEADAIAKARATGASEARALALGAEARAQVMANYEAMKSPSLMKQVAASIFNWQTLLVLGITIIVMYSKEISEWAKNLSFAGSSAKQYSQTIKELNEINKEANKTAGEQLTNMRLLYVTMKDETASRQQRLAAAKELQELYPKVFGNMTTEQMMLKDTTYQYNQLTNAIRANAMAEAIKNKISAKSTEWLDKENEFIEKVRNEQELIREMEARIASGKGDKGLYASDQEVITAAKDRIKRIIAEYVKGYKDFNAQAEYWEKRFLKYEKESFISTPNTKEPEAKKDNTKSDADRANRESLEALKQQYKDQKDAIENKYKLQLKAVEDNIKLAKDDPYLSSVEKNQKQM